MGVCNLVSRIDGRTQIENGDEQGNEASIWTYEGKRYMRLHGKFQNLNSSPNITAIYKSRNIKAIGEIINPYKILV